MIKLYVYKKCKICNKKFFGFHTSKYCSNICGKISHSESVKRWLNNRKKEKKEDRFCVYCNNILSKGRKKFCSFECNIKYRKKISENIKKLKKEKRLKNCKICDELFYSKSKLNIYCIKELCQKEVKKRMDKRHRIEKKKLLQKKTRNCKECGKKFNLGYKIYRYCSDGCKQKRNKRVTHQKNKIKYYKNIKYRLQVLLRTRFKRAMKNGLKKESAIKLIGCSINELKQHLENQFIKGMSWENYGFYGWHIDHIKPCSRFDLFKLEEQQKCFHYTNLQPMWATENLIKSDNYEINKNKKDKKIKK